jgi:membrane protease YdiL (CAAX protease family)
LVLLFLAMLTWPLGPLARVKALCEEEVVPLLAQSTWSELALIAVSVGVGEEMLFRGVFQASLASWLGTALGIALASLLFGLLHPISPTFVVLTTFLGMYLGVEWIINKNLLAVMVTHAVYYFAVLGYLIRVRNPGEESPDSEVS